MWFHHFKNCLDRNSERLIQDFTIKSDVTKQENNNTINEINEIAWRYILDLIKDTLLKIMNEI